MGKRTKLEDMNPHEVTVDIASSLRMLVLLEGIKGGSILATPSSINTIAELFQEISPTLDVLRPLGKVDDESV